MMYSKEWEFLLTVGIMEILFKGTVIKKKNYEINEIEEMVVGFRKRDSINNRQTSKITRRSCKHQIQH